jgi:transmembrane sensor
MNPDEQQKNQIKALALKWQEGTITEEEKLLFNQWYHSFEDPALKDITSEQPVQLRKRLYNHIAERENLTPAKSWFQQHYFAISAIAAVLALVVAVYGYYFYTGRQNPQQLERIAQHKPILPGGNKAVLTLADGSAIVLNQRPNGVLTMQGTVAVRKGQAGILNYENTKNHQASSAAAAFNTVTTPRGGQYQLILSDGTKVWLNAASSLKFPVSFNPAKREVELTGEAYFEVNTMQSGRSKQVANGQTAQDRLALTRGKGSPTKRIPFLVKTNSQVIEVLGTHFNVNAYADEPDTRTTLLEGAVKIRQRHKPGSALLKPGQQGLTGTGDIQVSNVDVSQAVAWQQGYFLFDNESMESIMRKISRWYDVDVTYSGNIRYRKFGGRISRFENIGEILRMMEKTQVIHFRTTGRRVTVMP